MEYEDFTIDITPHGKHCKVRVRTPFGEEHTSFELDIVLNKDTQSESNPTVELVTRGERKSKKAFSMYSSEFGSHLFDLIFKEKVLRKFDECKGKYFSEEGSGLRIKISLNLKESEIDYLFSMPWELMKDDKRFLSLDQRSPVVRYLEVPVPPVIKPVKEDEPFRVLILASNPADTTALDLESEIELVEQQFEEYAGQLEKEVQSIDEKRIELTVKRHASSVDFVRALIDNEYDVIHFMGHGVYDNQLQRGMLLFEKDDKADLVDVSSLLQNFSPSMERLKLVFLNACETAMSGLGQKAVLSDGGDGDAGSDPFSGIATSLVESGVPAVVAMQKPINDEAAIAFSRTFYSMLFEGQPLETCMTQARNEIHIVQLARSTNGNASGTLEWATPVLFLHADDGRLFATKKETPENEPGPAQTLLDPSNAREEKRVYLYYQEEDRRRVKGLRKLLRNTEHIDLLLPRFERSDPRERRQAHINDLTACDAYIQVHGEQNSQWEDAFEKDLKQLEYKKRQSPFMAKFKFVVPPENDTKEEWIDEDPNVIDGMNDECTPKKEDVDRFLERLFAKP